MLLNNHVYTCLLSALLSNGRIAEALNVPSEMAKAGIRPDARTFGTLTSGLIRSNDIETARVLTKKAFAQGPGIERDTLLRLCRTFGGRGDEVGAFLRSLACWNPETRAVVGAVAGKMINK